MNPAYSVILFTTSSGAGYGLLALLGLVGVYTIGAAVHALLVIAIVLFLIGFINGRRTVV